jgi:hypothetical protein
METLAPVSASRRIGNKPVALRTKVGSSVRGVAHIDPAVNVNREFGVA